MKVQSISLIVVADDEFEVRTAVRPEYRHAWVTLGDAGYISADARPALRRLIEALEGLDSQLEAWEREEAQTSEAVSTAQ